MEGTRCSTLIRTTPGLTAPSWPQRLCMLALLMPPLAGAATILKLDASQELVVQQCAEAARLVGRAAQHFPHSEPKRQEFLLTMYGAINRPGMPPVLVPRSAQLISARAVMEALLDEAPTTADEKILQERILTLSAAACALDNRSDS